MTRYPYDGLTVAVFANLDSGYAQPGRIARVIAGLVLPALMPAPAKALPDDPTRATRILDLLLRAAVGQDVAGDYDPIAAYKLDLREAKEPAASLPAGWQTTSLTLIGKTDNRGGIRYGYRIGAPGDTRRLVVTTMPSDGLMDYAVVANPDNR